jgi:hypothetical protein
LAVPQLLYVEARIAEWLSQQEKVTQQLADQGTVIVASF